MAKGDLPLAREFLDGVHRIVGDPTTSEFNRWRYSTHLFISFGEWWLARGDPARARELAEQGLEIASRTNSRKYLVAGWRLQGEIASSHGEHAEAERWLRQALQLAQTVGNPMQLWHTHVAWGRLHEAAHRLDAAQQASQAARAVLERVKENLRHPELRAGLEGSWRMQQTGESL